MAAGTDNETLATLPDPLVIHERLGEIGRSAVLLRATTAPFDAGPGGTAEARGAA